MTILLMLSLFILTLSLVGLLLKKEEDIFFILMTVVFSVTWVADELMLLPHFFTWSIELLIFFLESLISLFFEYFFSYFLDVKMKLFFSTEHQKHEQLVRRGPPYFFVVHGLFCLRLEYMKWILVRQS